MQRFLWFCPWVESFCRKKSASLSRACLRSGVYVQTVERRGDVLFLCRSEPLSLFLSFSLSFLLRHLSYDSPFFLLDVFPSPSCSRSLFERQCYIRGTPFPSVCRGTSSFCTNKPTECGRHDASVLLSFLPLSLSPKRFLFPWIFLLLSVDDAS